MATLPFILTTFHQEADEHWTERTRFADRDEAINEGRARLDIEADIRQFTVEAMELRGSEWHVLTSYRETAWRVPK